jgi:hypothetical protein
MCHSAPRSTSKPFRVSREWLRRTAKKLKFGGQYCSLLRVKKALFLILFLHESPLNKVRTDRIS